MGGVVEPIAARGDGFFQELARRLETRERVSFGETGLRAAAVLVPLLATGEGEVRVLFTRRPENLKAHAGQVSFPGGSIDAGESALACALRETEEELGIPRACVETLGALDDRPVITGFNLTPWVGRIPAGLVYAPNAAEVARVFDVALDALVDPARTRFRFETMERNGFPIDVPFFETDGEVIWGATGRVLLQLLEVTLGFAPPEPA